MNRGADTCPNFAFSLLFKYRLETTVLKISGKQGNREAAILIGQSFASFQLFDRILFFFFFSRNKDGEINQYLSLEKANNQNRRRLSNKLPNICSGIYFPTR